MPIIVEYSYADGTKEKVTYPVQVWRKNDAQVTKVLATDKELTGVLLDPDLETADVDVSNNRWPKQEQESEFDSFKEGTEDQYVLRQIYYIKKPMFLHRLLFFLYICSVMSIPLFISGGEIAFVIFIVIMVFGADKVPDIARGLGKGMRTLKNATEDIKSEITKSADKQGINTDIAKDMKKEIDDAKKNIEEITGSVKRKF